MTGKNWGCGPVIQEVTFNRVGRFFFCAALTSQADTNTHLLVFAKAPNRFLVIVVRARRKTDGIAVMSVGTRKTSKEEEEKKW